MVNSKVNERHDKAQAIAQCSLAGGGDLDKGRAATPLPPSAITDLGDPAEEVQRKIESKKAQQMQLRTQFKNQLSAMPPTILARMTQDPAQAENEEKRRQQLIILPEIEQSINTKQKDSITVTSARPHAKRSMRCMPTACTASSKARHGLLFRARRPKTLWRTHNGPDGLRQRSTVGRRSHANLE